MLSSLLSRPCWRRAVRHLPASTNAFMWTTTTRQFSSTSVRGRVISGPKQTFRTGLMAQQALASAVASAGSTVVLTTITAETGDTLPTSSSSLFLTNEFRERHHAVGQMPKQRHRRDNRMLSLQEVLASRAIDRALRPLLRKKWSMQQQGHGASLSNQNEPYIHRWHVSSSLQALNHRDYDKQQEQQQERGGDPIPLAINTAAALLDLNVAAVSLAVMWDGTQLVVREDAPGWGASSMQDDAGIWVGNLLYAGTQQGQTVMMEWGAAPYLQNNYSMNSEAPVMIGLPDHLWPGLLDMARASLESRFDWMQEFTSTRQESTSSSSMYMDEAALRASLGLSLTSDDDDDDILSLASGEVSTDATRGNTMEELVQESQAFCEKHLRESFLRLCGWNGDESLAQNITETSPSLDVAFPSHADRLPSKSIRGRKEDILQKEVKLLVKQFLEERETASDELGEEEISEISGLVFRAQMQKALFDAATLYGCRPDERRPRGKDFGVDASGRNTVRPIKAVAPALPDSVHGSAYFSRGDTGVLCTVTLASPKEGRPDQDPFDTIRRESHQGISASEGRGKSANEYYNLPVGSLRFLRTQEALVSDLNSRNSLADKERTGSSGSLAEVQRAYLQYDFPDYSTGRVPGPGQQSHNRRALGHGALAEKALLPVLPSPETLPFAIRITAETVDSNGSSSMAAICGGLLALLDAGVPVIAAVAGISIGLLAADKDTPPSDMGLVLDLTGTEDHYGLMDFKIGGTRDAVTALQLDVKEPIDLDILVSALELGRAGRCVVLDEMESQIPSGLTARSKPKLTAPAVEVVKYDASRKRDLIGPGGIVLRQIEERYSVSIDLTQEGRCLLYGEDRELVSKAKSTVMDLVADVEVGEKYQGTIVELKDFGAIVELLRNKEGILHVSELTDESEAKDHPEGIAGFVREFLKVGQTIDVEVISVDPIQGSIKLSRKAVLQKTKRATWGKEGEKY